MFKITPNPTFEIDVLVHVPGAETPGTIRFTFKYLNPEQLKKWQADQGNNSVNDALQEIALGWSGVETSAGEQVPFSKENLTTLLETYHSAGEEITRAYLAEIFGAKRKN